MGRPFSKTFMTFLGGFLLINLLQAYVTPLIYDEAYYWYYAKEMAWGYFDHPPMVALLVKLSGIFFDGELGVRFLGCLLWAGTLMLLWTLVRSKEKEDNVPLFFLLAFSMVLFNAYGFLTLPDTPLLFFTALFLKVYKAFLEKNSWGRAVLLGLCMAALMYSKYHAALVIVFILISNIRLVLNGYAWLSVLVALACFSPHLIWLYDHDFVSVKYHLFERPNQAYSFEGFTLGYLLNLIVNFGLLFPWFYWALIKARPKDAFEKGLLFLTYGILLFFFMSSFQRRAQAQWIIVACIPMLLICFDHLLGYLKDKKWLWRIGIFGTLLILYVRAWLVYHPLIPFTGYETHGAKEWVKTLSDIVGDTPVVFENSYRRAPMYSFYSGKPSFSLNNIFYRQNQYTIDSSEYALQHKRVAYVTPYANSGDFNYTPFRTNKYYGWYIDDFESFRKLRCFLKTDEVKLKDNEQKLYIANPYNEAIILDKLKLSVAYLDKHKRVVEVRPLEIRKEYRGPEKYVKSMDTVALPFVFPAPNKGVPKYIKFSISENGLRPGINSASIKVAP